MWMCSNVMFVLILQCGSERSKYDGIFVNVIVVCGCFVLAYLFLMKRMSVISVFQSYLFDLFLPCKMYS